MLFIVIIVVVSFHKGSHTYKGINDENRMLILLLYYIFRIFRFFHHHLHHNSRRLRANINKFEEKEEKI
jgi:hypothetical protein